MAYDALPPLRQVLAAHGLQAKRSLGQNFLLDLNLTARIARAAGPLEGITVLEIGPGPGGLTRALLAEGAARVLAVERDARCLAALAEIAAVYPGRLEVIEGDALVLDPSVLAELAATPPVRIVANLPYNVATPLLVGWLQTEPWPPWWDRLVLMFQHEVAMRITAGPGNRIYGRLSVLAQWRATARAVFTVDAKAFTPPPKVTSAIVEITPGPMPDAAPPVAAISAVTAAAFGQRRKMLRQSLKSTGVDPGLLLAAAGLDETLRAEDVAVADFVTMARALQKAQNADR
ncbi:SSU rRNA (adenine(1518)-N(6)/adenine(1519)-N(6))-dimethyltransferase [hydrothermal vent metagenome]|uniref:SSU rRNA (Adenine(1518)-N(6)/adenine(1519)-N(6))-dimethyltransferase n=1 Tax=hydrothermal vent metagenome TaxID=652676 RepID=A0A3B0TFM7_9ZZZZ